MTTTMERSGQVFAAWRPPFSAGAVTLHAFAPGATLAQMAAEMPGLPIDWDRRGSIVIGGHEIDRAHWHRVRPKPGQRVTFHYALARGGESGGGGKRGILSIVVAVAAVALSVFTLGGGFGAILGASFAQGALGAKLLAAGISLAGSLAQSALSAPPAAAAQQGPDRQKGPASISGNVLAAGAPIPCVIGTRRVFPPLACQPLTYRSGDNEITEGVFVLAGPHDLAEIRVGDVPLEEAEDIEYQIREGWDDDAPIDLVERYAVTKTPSLELVAQAVDSDEQDVVEDQVQPDRSMPKWSSLAISADADEAWLHLVLPEGLYETDGGTGYQLVPFRLRMRAQGEDDWINLPELQFQSKDQREIRASIMLKWAEPPEQISPVPQNSGWTAAYKYAPGQDSPNPVTEAWTAAASFSAGSGNDGLYYQQENTTNVRRVGLGATEATIYLDEATFPRGTRWELQIKRGLTVRAGKFSKSAYTYSSNTRDLFWYIFDGGRAEVIRPRDNLADRVYLVRSSSVFNSHPIAGGRQGPGLAVIAIRASNRQIENLSVLASRYVPDWNGTAWANWVTTSNPAPHYHDVLRGALTPDRLDGDIVDNASLVAWRQACIDEGYTCDMVCEGTAANEVLARLASCGYARPRASETWGVIRDYDRSGDDPEQIFTSRNSSSLTMTKAFPRLPDAFRVVFQSAANDDAEEQVIVFRKGREDVVNPRIEEVRYEGIDNTADAVERAEFDLLQAELRSTFWSFSAPAEAIRVTRGDLIGVNHDVLDVTHGSARILDVETLDGDVVAIVLDSAVPVYAEADMTTLPDMLAVADMTIVGVTTSVAIRRSDGTTSQHPVSGVTGSHDRLEFATPVAVEDDDDGRPVIREDCLVCVGRPGTVMLRLIVTDMTYDRNQTARITAVDEAPELWT